MASPFRPDSWPFATRTVVDLMLAATPPLALAVTLVAARGRSAVEDESRHNLQLVAQVVATQIDQLLDDTHGRLRQIAEDERVVRFCAGDASGQASSQASSQAFGGPPVTEAIRRSLFAAIQDQLRRIRRDDTDIASIFLTDADGIGINGTHDHDIGQDLTFREHWREGRVGRRHVSDLLVGTRSRETGIDFDFIDVANLPNGLLIAVGDVVGHGIGSALVMASARGALRAAVADRDDLPSVMSTLNRIVAHDSRDGRFMTLLIMTVDPTARRVRWTSAGHDPALLLVPGVAEPTELAGRDMPLGIDADGAREAHEIPRPPPGSILLLGTDGIWETQRGDGEMYGKQRLAEVIQRGVRAGRSALEIATAIEADLADFRGSARILDDITFVVVCLDPTDVADEVVHDAVPEIST